MRIYIFGLGKGKEYVDRCLRKDVEIIAFIDNYRAENISIDGIPVIKQQDISDDYDYIVISLMMHKEIRLELANSGIEDRKLISFFDFDAANNSEYWQIIDSYKWRTELQWKHYREFVLPLLWNINYEISADKLIEEKLIPRIHSAEEAIDIIVSKQRSLVRLGDGEFEQIRGMERANFQDADKELGAKLQEILDSEDERIVIAIADNYGSLEKYTDEAARGIREYMTPEVRRDHMRLLNPNKTYYDAYLSRTYLMYRDKANAGERFKNRKRIWENRDVLIIEGEHTRFGVGNDLLDNSKSIERILCPDKNAYSKYDNILDNALEYGKGKLILVVLGPTATLLAYDLAIRDYWAVDIGQLDTEYEWFLRGAETKCIIPNKTVSELTRYSKCVTDIDDPAIKKYYSEVVAQI